MSQGKARRVRINNVEELRELIENVKSDQAIALGALRVDLPEEVGIVRQVEVNGQTRPDIIARIAANIHYRAGQPAFALIDSDTKGMPADIAAEIRERGGYWQTLRSLFLELGDILRVTRNSTSAGLFRTDTGEKLPGSDGLHVYLAVKDGQDVERFLKTLHDRCWLSGFGWMMVGKAGQLLDRSLIDRSVFGGERLVFEGAPILQPPLGQDYEVRRPVMKGDNVLDTVVVFPPLTIAEKAKLSELKSKAAFALTGEIAKARNAFIQQQAAELVKRTNLSMKAAERIAARHCNGVLLPPVVLPFDDPEFQDCTVGDVLADPDKFTGATLADPLEGIKYGRGKAKIMRRSDGTVWINSFAHGRSVYELKYDAAAVQAAIDKADASDAVAVLIRMSLFADLDEDELDNFKDEVHRRSNTGKRRIDDRFKKAHQKRTKQQQEEEAKRRAAQRNDPRPAIRVPAKDAPWQPTMDILNDVLGNSTDLKPPARNINGYVVCARKMVLPRTHAFVSETTSEENAGKKIELPPPEQWGLQVMDEIQLAELIERHIDFVDHQGRSVHLPLSFVKHYLQRDDGALPTLVAIGVSPLVLPDGEILAPEGLDRDRGILFEIPPQLRALLPAQKDCTDKAVADAMRFLCDEWLCDVATDLTGKAIVVASSLTLIERSLLPERVAYFATAGKRCGGKTTTIKMAIIGAMGIEPAACAWSDSEEERRKNVTSQLMVGAAHIVWDNIKKGEQISSPCIEMALTSESYEDRILGTNQMANTVASAIHFFTGNNIGPRGDLASRCLKIGIKVDRPDPENRDFTHPNPLDWTKAHRADILRALYTILLGNPQLQKPADAPAHTRFKMWWRLVGSAVENAVKLYDDKSSLDFRDLFLEQEESEDEDTISLIEFLETVLKRWPDGFTAAEMAVVINDQNEMLINRTLVDFLYPQASKTKPMTALVSAASVSKQLRMHLETPVKSSDGILKLVTNKPAAGQRAERNVLRFCVERKNGKAA
jgi:hypothetical protein